MGYTCLLFVKIIIGAVIIVGRLHVVLTITVVFSPLDTTLTYNLALTLKPQCFSIVTVNDEMDFINILHIIFMENPCCKVFSQASQLKSNIHLYMQLFLGLHCN